MTVDVQFPRRSLRCPWSFFPFLFEHRLLSLSAELNSSLAHAPCHDSRVTRLCFRSIHNLRSIPRAFERHHAKRMLPCTSRGLADETVTLSNVQERHCLSKKKKKKKLWPKLQDDVGARNGCTVLFNPVASKFLLFSLLLLFLSRRALLNACVIERMHAMRCTTSSGELPKFQICKIYSDLWTTPPLRNYAF